jgi:hypothetical protein
MPTETFILRLVSESLAAGEIAGQIEHVETGAWATVQNDRDLTDAARRLGRRPSAAPPPRQSERDA